MKSNEEIIAEIKRYIDRTGPLPVSYSINVQEAPALAAQGAIQGVLLAFEYGRAKGARAAKAGAKAVRQE